jgi:hypothetical protein
VKQRIIEERRRFNQRRPSSEDGPFLGQKTPEELSGSLNTYKEHDPKKSWETNQEGERARQEPELAL